MVGPLQVQAKEPACPFEIRIVSLAEWLDAYARLRAPTVEQMTLQRGIVTRIPTALFPVIGFQAGDPVGYGLGVIDSKLIGVFGLHVTPTARKSGLGKAMLRRIFQWTEIRGAGRAYLQVEANNDPALRLH